jgi:hypothetical protein
MSVTSIVYDMHVAVSSPVFTVLKMMPVYTSKFIYINFFCSWVCASWINVSNCPTRCNFIQFLFPANCCTCFGWHLHPSSGARVNCNYSIWHSPNRMLTSAVDEESEWVLSPQRQRKVAYGSVGARCCNYSLLVLLKMGEGWGEWYCASLFSVWKKTNLMQLLYIYIVAVGDALHVLGVFAHHQERQKTRPVA